MKYRMIIYIKYLPKDKLLYALWLGASQSPNFYYCPLLMPILTEDIAKTDINYMIANNRDIDLTTYYGKSLYINITNDTVDTNKYDIYNCKGVAEKIITNLKEKELNRTVCVYYKFY